MKLKSYLGGQWCDGAGDGAALTDPTTGEVLARASTAGLDLGAGLAYARDVGGPALRALGYGERAGLLGAIADVLKANYAAYVETAKANSGNTRADADMDISGAIFTLKYYARLGAGLGAAPYLVDGAPEPLSRDGDFQAVHVQVPRQGAAIHINAFNFPAWGLWEKAAVSLLAGVPVVAKPATATALLAHDMVRDVIAAGVLPEGALSLICGAVGDLLDHVDAQDAIAFTGSAATAASLRAHSRILETGARLNVEADSINASLLGPDAGPDSPEFALFVREVVREMTVKAGQKCTAIRRALVPAGVYEAACEALAARVGRIVVGDPRNEDVRMGPVVNKAQQSDVLATIDALLTETRRLTGDPDGFAPVGADKDTGCFVPPTLLACDAPEEAAKVHEIEAFGPVCVVMPYKDEDAAWSLVAAARGCLVASVFTADDDFAVRTAQALAPWNGRLLFVGDSIGKSHTGHGNVMPSCLHGGPGRAGGGEELGGMRGLAFYHQRTAVQGAQALISRLSGNGGEQE